LISGEINEKIFQMALDPCNEIFEDPMNHHQNMLNSFPSISPSNP